MKQTVAASLPRLGAGSPSRQWRLRGVGLFAALLAIALLPALATNLAVTGSARTRLLELAAANARERSASTAAAIDSYLLARRGDIVRVSQAPDVISYLQNQSDQVQREAARSALGATAAVSPAYESIAALGVDGTIVAASNLPDEGTNVRFRDYFQNARAGAVFISDPSYSVITNRPALFLSAPVRNANGLLVGVVSSRLSLAQIWDFIEADADSVGQGTSSMLVDGYGIRLGLSDTRNARDRAEALILRPIAPIDLEAAKRLAGDRRFGQKSPEQLMVDPLPELKSIADSLPTGGTGSFVFQSRGSEQRAVATRLQSKPWVYMVAVPTTSYTGILGDGTIDLVAGVALTIALAFAGAAFLPRAMSGPLHRMARLGEQVAAGEVSPENASFEALAEDEISEEVGSAFDRVAVRLSQAVRLIGRPQ